LKDKVEINHEDFLCAYYHSNNRFREDTDGTLEVGLNFWFWPAWLRVKDDGSSCQEKNAKFISSSKGNESSDEAAILITCELQGLNTYVRNKLVKYFIKNFPY